MLTTLHEIAAGLPMSAVLPAAAVLLIVESGTLAGLALPGTTLLVALGLWTAASPDALVSTITVAATATVTGAQMAWWRGRTRGNAVPTRNPRSNVLARRARTRATAVSKAGARWLADRGPGGTAALLACGHWAAVARPMLPRLAGAAGVRYRIAGPALTASGTAWATTLVLLGHGIGPHVLTHATWAPIAVVALLIAAIATRSGSAHRGHS